MKTVSLWNKKGGVGKSTLSVNLAASVSFYFKKKVLLVDCDPQGNTSSYLDIAGEHAGEPTLSDYFCGNAAFSDIVQHYHFEKKVNFVTTKGCDVDLIPCNDSLKIAEKDITDTEILANLVKDQDYDLVIFDCPPADSNTALAALIASDYVLVPANPNLDSLGGFQSLVDIINEIKASGKSIDILGIIINEYASAEALDRYILEQLSESDTFSNLMFDKKIRRSSIVKQCRFFGQPICIKAEREPIGKDYEAVTREFAARIGLI